MDTVTDGIDFNTHILIGSYKSIRKSFFILQALLSRYQRNCFITGSAEEYP